MIAEYPRMDGIALAEAVARGEVTPDALLDAALKQLARWNPHLNAVVLLREEVARAQIRAGLAQGPLWGVPTLLKDLGAEARDLPAHCGSRALMNTTWPADSEILIRMKAAGLVPFGRTTAPEGGIGVTTEAAVHGGPTRNPWDLTRSPGGSSGGAAAAVAAGIVPVAHGSDGGGSLRIPAAACGIFALKPTRARMPDGPFAGEAWAGMATEGFVSRSVRDTAAALDACAGADPGAPYWAPPLGAGFRAAIARPPRRLRIALCDTTYTGAPIDPALAEAARAAGRLLADLGHHVAPARPAADFDAMLRAWTDIVACGTAQWVRTSPAPDRIEPLAASAVAHAANLSGADYLDALDQVHAFGRQMAAFFIDWDILLSPTLAEPPALLGRFDHSCADYRHYRHGPGMCFDFSPYCAAFNASGQPAASVPLYQGADGLPIGIHLGARFGADEELIALCAELEAALPWADRRPPDPA